MKVFLMNKLGLIDKSLINSFSYHDAVITNFVKDGNECVLTFTDGWEQNQVNEIRMVNCEIINKYDLKDRLIYQLGFIDYCDFDSKSCLLELYVWYDDCLTEVVKFRADDFIAKSCVGGELIKEECFSSLFKN